MYNLAETQRREDVSSAVITSGGRMQKTSHKTSRRSPLRTQGAPNDPELTGLILASLHQMAISVYSPDGTILGVWGKDAANRFGIDFDAIRGQNLSDVIPSESATVRTNRIRESARTGRKLRDVYLLCVPGGEFWVEVTLCPRPAASGDGQYVVAFIRDITEQRQAEAEMERRNIALQELLASVESRKEDAAQAVAANVDKLIKPLLRQLRATLSPQQAKLLDMTEQAMAEITDPFAAHLSGDLASLTPAEIRICHLIRSGNSSKEIGQILHVSEATVNKHRERVRRKLGIANNPVNLATHLGSLLAGQ